MINAIARKKNFKKQLANLPYGYAVKVVQMLTDKGFNVNKSQVIDIKRGKLNDETLTIPVLKAIIKVKRQHERKLKRINKLRAA